MLFLFVGIISIQSLFVNPSDFLSGLIVNSRKMSGPLKLKVDCQRELLSHRACGMRALGPSVLELKAESSESLG